MFECKRNMFFEALSGEDFRTGGPGVIFGRGVQGLITINNKIPGNLATASNPFLGVQLTFLYMLDQVRFKGDAAPKTTWPYD